MNEEYRLVLHDPAKVLLGKNGVTPGFIEHLKTRMKAQKMLKVKVHKEAVEEHGMDHLITEIFRYTKFYVLDARGHTFILSKKKIEDKHVPKKYLDLREQIRMEKKNLKAKAKAEEAELRATAKKAKQKTAGPQPTYDYIDYDDEKAVAQVDKASDLLYGEVPEETPLPTDERKEKPPKVYKKSSRPKPKSGYGKKTGKKFKVGGKRQGPSRNTRKGSKKSKSAKSGSRKR